MYYRSDKYAPVFPSFLREEKTSKVMSNLVTDCAKLLRDPLS